MTNPRPGDIVILLNAPSALMSGLPEEDQTAILSVVGKQVKFSGIAYGQAEIDFQDSRGDRHTIWVDTDLIGPA